MNAFGIERSFVSEHVRSLSVQLLVQFLRLSVFSLFCLLSDFCTCISDDCSVCVRVRTTVCARSRTAVVLLFGVSLNVSVVFAQRCSVPSLLYFNT